MAIDNDFRNEAPSDLIEAPKCASGLSTRECTVLSLAGQGATDKEIADRLDMNVASLRTQWTRIREKLGAVNRTHAIALASVERPAADIVDNRARLVESLRGDRVASWVWQSRSRQALFDRVAARLFAVPTFDAPIPYDRLLAHVWAPDRARFERFLIQSGDLRPMTPIELRVGTPGDYRTLIRTVNLAIDSAYDPSMLLASTTIHVFPA